MRIASLYWFVFFTFVLTSKALATGYIATEELENGVTECSALNTFRCARGIERKQLVGKGSAVNRSAGNLQIQISKRIITVADERTEITYIQW
ncbi:MAG: hypothetical protein Q7U28_13885 [Aquabacterium sp.]|nr:hypothetical protein [Aquabacterium sp.]